MPRPSGAPIWVPCPGAPTQSDGLKSSTSDLAREGQAAHWLGAEMLTGQLWMDMVELIDRQAPNGVFIDEKMCRHVQTYIDEVFRLMPSPYVEQPVDIPEICPGEPGTSDAHGWHALESGCMAIAELKYGFRIIEAFENWQMICYSLGIYRLVVNAGYYINHFDFTIVQPRAPHINGPVRNWRVSVEELQRDYWPRAIAAAQGGNCITGLHCNNCLATLNCGAFRQASASATQFVAGPLAEEYTGEQLAVEISMLEFAQVYLEARLESMSTLATDRAIKMPGSIPGWDIERGTGGLKWRDESDLVDIEAVTGVKLHKDKPLTPNQAIEAGLSSKIINQYADRSLGKPKLVKHSSAKINKLMGKPPAI